MARFLPISSSQLIIFILLCSLATILVTAENDGYVRSIDSKLTSLKERKLSHLRVYWHDIYGGSNPTAAQILKPPSNGSITGFGSMSMIDDPLTEGPELSSKLVGKAQGFYGQASQHEVGLIMVMNFVFMEGKYNGSTITILGRNSILLDVREMSVVGGTGVFRFASGYVQASTYKYDASKGDATVEYNIYVLH